MNMNGDSTGKVVYVYGATDNYYHGTFYRKCNGEVSVGSGVAVEATGAMHTNDSVYADVVCQAGTTSTNIMRGTYSEFAGVITHPASNASIKHHVTQGAVGAKLDPQHTRKNVCKWEHGQTEPNLRTVEQLAAVLDVSPCWLAWGCEHGK